MLSHAKKVFGLSEKITLEMASALLILLEPVALRRAFSEEPGLRIPPGQIAGPRTPARVRMDGD
jgi:hypothetical protein